MLAATVVGGLYLKGKYVHIPPGRVGFCTDLDQNVR